MKFLLVLVVIGCLLCSCRTHKKMVSESVSDVTSLASHFSDSDEISTSAIEISTVLIHADSIRIDEVTAYKDSLLGDCKKSKTLVVYGYNAKKDVASASSEQQAAKHEQDFSSEKETHSDYKKKTSSSKPLWVLIPIISLIVVYCCKKWMTN